MTSYTKRCTRTRRVCWCKFGWNPTRSFCVICNLVSLSLIQRQGLSLDFACLSIYSLAIDPELFVCLSIYENAETLSRLVRVGSAPLQLPRWASIQSRRRRVSIRHRALKGRASRHRALKGLQNSQRHSQRLTLVYIKQSLLLVKRKSHVVFCAKPWRTAKTPKTL